MDESLEDRPSMPAGCPEVATTTQPPPSTPDLHTVPGPMPIDIHTDKTQAPATTGVHEEGFPAPATVEDSPMSTSAPPINEFRHRHQRQQVCMRRASQHQQWWRSPPMSSVSPANRCATHRGLCLNPANGPRSQKTEGACCMCNR